jgi:2-methylcitrate dehydratase PrpD
VLGLIAVFDRAALADFDAHFQDPRVVALRRKVHMALDAEVDGAYPQRWIGKVEVLTTDGRTLHGRVDEPKGDPGNTLSRDEIEAKARQLAAYGNGASAADMDTLVARAWTLAEWPRTGLLLA